MPQFKHANSETIFAYWQSLGGSPVPHYRQWDPIKVPTLMPNVLIMQGAPDGGFSYRFAGTAICEFLGLELTGLSHGELLAPAIRESSFDNARDILEVPCAIVAGTITHSGSGRVSEVEYLAMPLCDDEGVPARIVAHMAVLETFGYENVPPGVHSRTETQWIDIGCGVPVRDNVTVLAAGTGR